MSCPFSNFTNYNQEWNNHRFPEKVLKSTLTNLEKVLKNNNRKTVKFVRKFDISYDNPLRYSYWPRLMHMRDSTVAVPSNYREGEQALPNCDNLLDMSGYEWADAQYLKTWYLNENGIKTVRMILHALAEEKSVIVYSPEMWNLCALFVHYHEPSVVINCLKTILKSDHWVAQTKDEWKAKVLSMAFYLSPKGAKHPQVLAIFENWMKAVWELPFKILVLIVDSFLVEGYKIFYRAAIVLCSDSRSKFSGEIKLEDMAKIEERNPQDFRDAMFSIRGMSRKKILKAMKNATDFLSTSKESFDKYVNPCVTGGKLTRSAILEECSSGIGQCIKAEPKIKQIQGEIKKEEVVTPPVSISKLISNQEISSIVVNVDDENIAKICKPKLVYASETDGSSMGTLLNKAPEKEGLLLVEVDTKPEKSVVGAFLYDKLEKKDEFYGRGKTFVFKAKPGSLEFYKWKEAEKKDDNTLYKFQRVTNDCIEIGAGKESHSAAIHLNENLSKLSSGPSNIFDSPCLFHGMGEGEKKHGQDETVDAPILRVELFSFVEL